MLSPRRSGAGYAPRNEGWGTSRPGGTRITTNGRRSPAKARSAQAPDARIAELEAKLRELEKHENKQHENKQ